MSNPVLHGHLDPSNKVLDDPPTFFSWDRVYCCCDCCLQIRDSRGGGGGGLLWYTLFLRYPRKLKFWGVQVRCMRWPLRVTPVVDQFVRETLLQPRQWFDWGVGMAPSCWNHWRSLRTLLRRPSAEHIVQCWLSQTARCRPRTRMVQWCHVWRWRSMQCTWQSVLTFADSTEGVCYPRGCYFYSSLGLTVKIFTFLTTRCASSQNQTLSRKSCSSGELIRAVWPLFDFYWWTRFCVTLYNRRLRRRRYNTYKLHLHV